MTTTTTRTTGQVRKVLGLTERQINYHLAGMPDDLAPPIVMGRRAWSDADVEALRGVIEAKRGSRGA